MHLFMLYLCDCWTADCNTDGSVGKVDDVIGAASVCLTDCGAADRSQHSSGEELDNTWHLLGSASGCTASCVPAHARRVCAVALTRQSQGPSLPQVSQKLC